MSRPLLVLALLASGCFVPRDSTPPADRTCTRCHGDEARTDVDALLRAAPPFDINGNTGTEFPGVGAHQLHLTGSDTHGPIACARCHPVPRVPGDEGHNDGVATFAPQVAYDAAARRCTNSCHGPSLSGVWTRPRDASTTCGTCHALPPPPPHAASSACGVCHADVIATDGGFVAPQLHVDGTKQVTNAPCDSCHGSGGQPAPATGAHLKHVFGGAQTAAVACASCHAVPATLVTANHPNGGPGEVLAAVGWSPATATCTNGCHGTPSPAWTAPNPSLSCSGCHGAPPTAPHPQVENCALCHPNATGPLGRLMADRSLHVNAIKETNVPTSCDGCHGGTNGNAAPPRDTRGDVSTSLPSVGAHQAHLVPRGFARVVRCEECHVVPQTVFAAGHLDGRAQVAFSGVATANFAQPIWRNGTCAGAACHDIANFTSADGGGVATVPVWTRVDGSQRTCDACHGLPPPPPHPARTDCASCHLNATASQTFLRPELHVNGVVEFELP